MRPLVGCLAFLVIASPVSGAATTFPWKASFNKASSATFAEVHEQIYAAHPEQLKAYAVSNLVWSEEDFELRLESGTIFVEPPIQGAIVGAFFEGKATVSFAPVNVAAQAGLKMSLNKAALEKVLIGTAYIFSLRADSPLMNLVKQAPQAGLGAPAQADTYIADKSAMRQLGLELTTLFLNRDGPARGASYILFPMEEIRITHSEEARLLYAFNPTFEDPVRLDVFGHEEMVAVKPYKFQFYTLASYSLPNERGESADLERSSVKISLGTGAKSAVEEARIEFRPAPGLRALSLPLTVRMQVSEVTSSDGGKLPFLQWEHLSNDPDFDRTLLVVLPDSTPAGTEVSTSITVNSTGILFEPWGSTFYIVNEDDWYPHFSWNDEAQHELELVIPKALAGIGIGEKVLEEGKDSLKRIVYRTTKPSTNSTFYYGDYTKIAGTADEIKVELYLDRTAIMEQKTANFTLTEITNALKVFNKMFVPLDIKNLRVASTPSEHGRGFEGLLLLGAGATGTSSESWADLFRAHEVAHQWWGQYVRPKSWGEDRWLAESFAEYSAMEYYKIRYEDRKKIVAVMQESWVNPLIEGTSTNKTLTGSIEKLIGGTIYPLNAGTENVYTKGPMVINMLRYVFNVQKGNDAAFFEMLKDFLRTYQYKEASTEDFRKVAEKNLGMNLDWFFKQWVEDGGVPILKWGQEIVQEDGSWVVKLQARQEQKNYRLLVPVYMHFPGDKVVVRPWLIEGESATRSFKLPSKPTGVSLNDNLEALLILKSL